MGFENFVKLMKSYFGVEAEEYPQNHTAKTYLFKIKPEYIREVAKLLKENGFDFFHTLAPVDYSPKGRGLELNYFFENVEERIWILIKTEIPLDNPEIDSLHDIYPSLEACEREEWEKFGIFFKGHPRLKPLLLDDTLQGRWVLRKSYIPEPHRK
ncbi:MAG TPA: NADH-quinone oxidoreductase subunit C [Aquifex aeolicus]|nr:NADH-quinone oxidoreductase subunit C [Aquificales bacterium]HIQ26854.1 NADH-quinone oxidoreductase subunit C [Aquifex aeolicus]